MAVKLSAKEISRILDKAGVLVKEPKEADHLFDRLSFDSRKVNDPNTLFVIKGAFKDSYIDDKKKNLITAFVGEKERLSSSFSDVPSWIVSDAQIALAALSAAYFGYPQKDLTILGITGTKGKTSSAYMAYALMDHLTDHKTALFSTIDTIINANIHFKSELTTPESFELFKNMRLALDNGIRYLVMEVSSQSYLKKRVFGIHFKVGSFLNISPDHIGINEHPTFADYLAHKKMLAENSDIFVSNIDDDHGQEFIDHAHTFGAETVSISSKNKSADVFFDIHQADLDHSIFSIYGLGYHKERFALDIPGDFNIYNAVNAIAMVKKAGFSPEKAKKQLDELEIPGRMVKLSSKKHGLIIVDYAHNGQSVTKLLEFLRTQHRKGRIIIVLGSPGDKGEDRRQQFGHVISRFADKAILTTDDPGTEDPHKINDQIRSAISNPDVELSEQLDRTKAIEEAIESAGPSDLVVLAAKGDDAFQKTNHQNLPYLGDRKVAIKVLSKLE